jgi:hypothetical protein
LRYTAAPGGPVLRLSGDAALEDLRANSLPGTGTAGFATGEELLAWTSLNLGGLDVSMAPGTATVVSVRETSLSDFYARLVINEAGRINLQDLVKSSSSASGHREHRGTAAPIPTAATTSLRLAHHPASAPLINFGPISMVGGKVLFSDRFIKPNYSANLSELTGKLSAFSSVHCQLGQRAPEMADLALRGRAEGTASNWKSLGKLNPLAQPHGARHHAGAGARP